MSSASAPLRKSPSGPKASSSGPVPAAFGNIDPQSLPAGPFHPISSVVSFDDWEPGDVLIIQAALPVHGAGDFPAFNVTLLPVVSLDDGATWQAIQGQGGAILQFTAADDQTITIPVLAAVACPSTPKAAIWNNGGGGCEAGYVVCLRSRNGGTPPGTTLVATP